MKAHRSIKPTILTRKENTVRHGGYQGGLEFYPMADDNLHIFLTAIGKKYNLSERAKALDASLDDTARLSIGFIYRLPLY